MNEGKDVRICPVCEREVERSEMDFTRDCHGIPFRLVCLESAKKAKRKDREKPLPEMLLMMYRSAQRDRDKTNH